MGPMNRKQKSAWAVLTEEEEKQLLDTTRLAPDKQAFRDYAMLSTALGSGLRVREMAELRVGDIMTPSGRGKRVIDLPFSKGGSPEPAYLGRPAQARLAVWVEELRRFYGAPGLSERALWPSVGSKSGKPGKPLAVRSLQSILARRLKAAGIGRRVRFHDCRHTYGSRAAEKTNGNIPVVQKLMRHADPRTTSLYVHAPLGAVLSAADKVLVG